MKCSLVIFVVGISVFLYACGGKGVSQPLTVPNRTGTAEEYHNNRGGAYAAEGKLNKAIAEFKKAIRINPNHAQAHSNLASVYYQQGKYDLAVKSYNKAIDIDPNLVEAHQSVGNVYYDKRKYDLAIESYNRVIAINPDVGESSEAYINRGSAYDKQGRYDSAIESYQKTLDIYSKNLGGSLNVSEVQQLINSLQKKDR